jgi:putative ABC transport system permease protein
MSFWHRLKYLLPSYRRAQESDLQDELRSLHSMAAPGELGNLTLAAENARAVWGWNWLDSTAQDFRYSLRTLFRHRRITLVALVSLALGIGANAVVFSLIDALLLAPLPYPESDRLVLVASTPPDNPQQRNGLTRGECAGLHSATDVFNGFGCYTDGVYASIGEYNTTPGETAPVQIPGRYFTAGVGQALGMQPLIGRWFEPAEEAEGADRVLLISFRLWQGRFGGSPDVVGKRVRFNGDAATIIGVMPENFEFLDFRSDFWSPFQTPIAGRHSPARLLLGVARLKAGVVLPAAQAKMGQVGPGLLEHSPEIQKDWKIALRPLARQDEESLASEALNPLLILQGAVAFVLLIACANVAGLLLAQATTQHREIAVRTALGSSRWRILRQLLTHSVLLAFAGGVLGLFVGAMGLSALTKVLPAGLPATIYQMHLDSGVLLFTLAISAASGLVVGLAPALQISQTRPLEALRESGRSSTAGVRRQRLRSVFVAGQIALAFILLAGVGLMLNSLVRLANAPLGFDPNNIVTIDVHLPEARFRRPTGKVLDTSGALEMEIDPQMYRTSEQIRRNLAALSGVISAGGIAIYPPFSGSMNMPIRLEGKPTTEQQRSQFLPILPDYFRTLDVRVVQGREFTPQDSMGAAPVAVINTAMAQRFWPNENPLGKLVQVDSPILPNQPFREVVGVVDEVKQYPGQEGRPQLYVSYLQVAQQHDERLTNELRRMTFVARTSRLAAEITPAMQAAVSAADNALAASSVRTMRDTAFGSMQRRRTYAGLLGTFALIAVLLAAIGIYGVIAQIVSYRTNEIGIRMALGANGSRVRSLVLRQGLPLVFAGLIFGVLGAFAVTRVIRSSLFGVSATDPLTFSAAAVVLGATALLACYLPARRASRIDPMLALRHE